MAFDPGLVEMIRSDLADLSGLDEKHMFGGLCFMLNGHMLCGVHKNGGMFRVGKSRQDAALAIEGVSELAFTGRKMGGMVDATDDAMSDDARRADLIALAIENVRSLPPR